MKRKDMASCPEDGGGGFCPERAVTEAFVGHIAAAFERETGGLGDQEGTALIEAVARRVLALQSASDALYHTSEHTMMVTLAGLDILRGGALGPAPSDWLHFLLALLMHDVGYARGACRGDDGARVVKDAAGGTCELPREATDAMLGPYHVERSMTHARETLAGVALVDAERIARAIAHTRFTTAPQALDAPDGSEGSLVRAADLIGQLADPRYIAKAPALFHELAETGQAAELGHTSPADLVTGFAAFFEARIAPAIGPAVACLERTPSGRRWLATLDRNLSRSRSAPARA